MATVCQFGAYNTRRRREINIQLHGAWELMNYKELRTGLRKRLERDQLSNNNAKADKIITALNKWQEHFQRDDSDEVSDDFGPDIYKKNLDKFSTAISDKVAESYLERLRSDLHQVYKFHLSISKYDLLIKTGNFAHVLSALMAAKELNNETVAKKLGVSSSTISNYKRGVSFPINHANIRKLSELLGLPKNELFKVIPIGPTESDEPDPSPLRSKMRRQSYAFKFRNWPEPLQEEWKRLTWYKTAPLDELGNLERSEPWKSKWSEKPVRVQMEMFFGFLISPPEEQMADIGEKENIVKGRGLNPEDLTLGLLTDTNLISAYKTFRNQRVPLENKNEYTQTGTFTNFLGSAEHLLSPIGFLSQHFELIGKKILPDGTPDQWKLSCLSSHTFLKKMRRGLKEGGHIKAGRKPLDELMPILRRKPDPLDEINELLDNIRRNIKLYDTNGKSGCYQQILLKRDAAIIAIERMFPLRLRNLTELKLKKNLELIDGVFHLKLTKDELKNWYSPAVSDYMILPLDYDGKTINTEIIQDYLNTARPYLVHYGKSDRVFLPSSHQGEKKAKKKEKEADAAFKDISARMVRVTATLSKTMSYSIHDFRHIVATHYVLLFPDGARRAAYVLFDTEKTVNEFYGKLKPDQGASYVFEGKDYGMVSKPKEQEKEKRTKPDSGYKPGKDPVSEFITNWGLEFLVNLTEAKVRHIACDEVEYVQDIIWERIQKEKRLLSKKLNKK